jgi:hypothetical protein
MKYLKLVMYTLLVPGYYFLAYMLNQNPVTQKYSWDMTLTLLPCFFLAVWILGGIRLLRKTIKLN